MKKCFRNTILLFWKQNPEFIERFDNFAFDEVVNSDDLDDKTRFIAILATLFGACQGVDEFSIMLGAAINFGVTPVESTRDCIYQATEQVTLGIGRVFPFLKVMNKVFTEKGIKLPLENQATTTTENRREEGTKAQVEIFGEGARQVGKTWLMKEFGQKAYKDTVYINFDSNSRMAELFSIGSQHRALDLRTGTICRSKNRPKHYIIDF